MQVRIRVQRIARRRPVPVIAEQPVPVRAEIDDDAVEQREEFGRGRALVVVEATVHIAQAPRGVAGLVGPTRRRSDQAPRPLCGSGGREERGELHRRMQQAELRIDDAVEGPVRGRCRARVHPRVAEQYMVELVHHEHREMRVRAAARRHEVRVDEHHRPRAERDRRGRDLTRDLDGEQLQQLAEGRMPQRYALTDAVGEQTLAEIGGFSGHTMSSESRIPRRPTATRPATGRAAA